MKQRIEIQKDTSYGRLDRLTLKDLTLQFEYGDNKLKAINFEGKRSLDNAEIIKIVTQLSAFEDFKLSTIKTIDSGTFYIKHVEVNDATAIIYTVPAGKRFYLFGYDCNAETLAAGLGMFAYVDSSLGADTNAVCVYRAAAGVRMIHGQNSFNALPIPEGYQLRAVADSNTYLDAIIEGVTVNA